ncbi:MAG: magnesium chelatase subunit [Acidobacteriota bacterium]|jgi:magnesium chelatase subunit H|nr:magnesium chelatase subunit [Acidobacteriota bacterium]
MNIAVLYVGSSLLGPLRQAEEEINREHALELHVAAHNFGASLPDDEWSEVEGDLEQADVVFVIHVMDGDNGQRLLVSLERFKARHRAVVVINCMPDLMRRTRMGKLDFGRLFRGRTVARGDEDGNIAEENNKETGNGNGESKKATRLTSRIGTWMGEQARAHRGKKRRSHTQYLKVVDRLPGLLRFVPGAGRLRDIKNYLYLFCYFLQPTPANIRSMLLYALKNYVPDARLSKLAIKIPPPESMPSVAIYHPDSPALFESFKSYNDWYQRRPQSNGARTLDPAKTIGLLLMRPQIISKTRKHYDGLIRAIEAQGLAVLPAISTLMDNREACNKFFVEEVQSPKSKVQSRRQRAHPIERDKPTSRVSQIISLTGFSFVGGPAMNDSEAATKFLRELNVPFHSAVSLDMQTVESWQDSGIGLNPVQAGMQIAIPELDGATEPFVYGGLHAGDAEPEPLQDRCDRLARRLARWNRLQTSARADLRLALMVFCFPPNKGNIGTAADLDVFPSVWEMLRTLKHDGYETDVPASADELREMLLGGNSEGFGATANVAYRMTVDEYLRLCPYAEEIEEEWGRAPGQINSFGGDLLIQGIQLGNIFIAVQPTFGYEGDPMRLLMARSGGPHHGFMALYTYLEKIFKAHAVVHVGTHGATEFMPGKQVGLSGKCWPDRLIGELPNVYIYSVNNPSEGTIAKRRTYAALISYLTPPIESAGLYKDFSSLKELLSAYRQSTSEPERKRLFATIEATSQSLHFM